MEVSAHSSLSVMVVLGTTIHEFACHNALSPRNSWMVGPSPTMTRGGSPMSSQPLRVALAGAVRVVRERRRGVRVGVAVTMPMIMGMSVIVAIVVMIMIIVMMVM